MKGRNSKKSLAHTAQKRSEGSYVMLGPNFWIHTHSAIFHTIFPKGQNSVTGLFKDKFKPWVSYKDFLLIISIDM